MASVHRVKTSKYWFGSFYKPDGGRVFRSTRQTDEGAALRVVMEWERVARGTLPASAEQARRVMQDIVKVAVGAGELRVTCAEYVQRWLESLRGTVADSTLAFYRGALESWVRWLGDRAQRPLDGIERGDIERWRVTGHDMRIPLSGELVRELSGRAAGAMSGAVFPELVAQIGRSGGYIGGVSKQFAHFLWLAGLRSHTPYGQGTKRVDDRRVQHELSFHSLRHTARTWLEEAGQPKAVIDALIGHDGDTGRIYTSVGDVALRTAAEVLAKVRKS